MKLVGFRKGQFTTNDNKVIEYANVYLLDKNPNVVGEMALSYKATLDVVDSLKGVAFGSEVKIYFDQYKRVNLVVPVGK